jgi:hypothetical protein
MKKHHVINSLHIVGLVVITSVIALLIGIFVPKNIHAPVNNPSVAVTPSDSDHPFSPLLFDIPLEAQNRIHPGDVITGTAPHTWFSEGNFPVTLFTLNDVPFALLTAITDEDWTITKNVSFTLTFPETLPYEGVGYISLSSHTNSLETSPAEIYVPVIFENNSR